MQRRRLLQALALAPLAPKLAAVALPPAAAPPENPLALLKHLRPLKVRPYQVLVMDPHQVRALKISPAWQEVERP